MSVLKQMQILADRLNCKISTLYHDNNHSDLQAIGKSLENVSGKYTSHLRPKLEDEDSLFFYQNKKRIYPKSVGESPNEAVENLFIALSELPKDVVVRCNFFSQNKQLGELIS